MKAIPDTLAQPIKQTIFPAQTLAANDQKVTASWRDYLELCKPNVVALMILTSVIGMMLASPTFPHWKVMLFGNLGIALMAASAAAINHVVDRKIDPIMSRTRSTSKTALPSY